MNHHKYLEKYEFETSLIGDRFVKYKIKLDKDFSEYFDSKCRYYFYHDNHKFELWNELTYRIEKLFIEDLIKCTNVVFNIVYDKYEKKINDFSINVKTYDKKNYGYWVTFVSVYNEPPF